MTVSAAYQRALADGGLSPDPGQAIAAEALQRVYDDLARRAEPDPGVLDRLKALVRPPAPRLVRGLYLWGGVGSGKTWLMDLFHAALPFPDKRREHFHGFMRHLHEELKRLGEVEDPLALAAERLSAHTRVLCLDEFQVSDIADAMLLGRLLEALFERGVALVSTSNTRPDDLYAGGLQRARFLPAIERLKSNTVVLRVESETDYRLRALERAEIYHHPLDAAADRSLAAGFRSLAADGASDATPIEVLGREIRTVRRAGGVVWFDFEALCNTPRSAADYIEIARSYHTVLLANVPIMGPAELDDRAQRFIQLVDELYDHNVNLIVSAAGDPQSLYPRGRLAGPFERTRSRLEEMQSRAYLAREHLA